MRCCVGVVDDLVVRLELLEERPVVLCSGGTGDTCDLASLLLHEMGHLAREDNKDNEPTHFFNLCHLNGCVNPAKFD